MLLYEEIKALYFHKLSLYESECVTLSDDLALHPEVSGEEYRSSQALAALLHSRGFEVELPFADIPTAFKAVYKPGEHRRNICILTEYDALPEIGHGCGHNVSAGISILSALALAELQDELDVNVHVIGTPREESDGAKCIMVRKGCFDDYDMAIMIHLYDSNYIDPKLYAMDLFEYKFHGKSAHSATAPWEGINALNGVTLMLHAVDMLRQHVKPDVRIHGVIRNGGQAPNIVPEEASCELYIRSLDRTYLDSVSKKVDDCARGAACATQTRWDKVPTGEADDNLKRNETGIEILREVYEELGLPVHSSEGQIFGSSDVGNVSQVCPTFQPTLQIAEVGTALHTAAFAEAAKSERAHEAVFTGAKIIGLHVIKIFSDSCCLEKIKEDFKSEQ